jgi:hypothetical protein
VRDRPFAVHNSMIDIWYMLIFGVIGYVFRSSTIRSRRSCWHWSGRPRENASARA